MSEKTPGLERPLESHRSYLRVLAGLQVPRNLRGQIDPSDVVQVTLMKAHERAGQFRGTTEAERAAWLRQILANAMIDAVRQLTRAPTVVGELQQSSAHLDAWLAADKSSPSEQAVRQEQLERLAGALAQLPEDQRIAVEFQQMQGLSVKAIAAQMGRSTSAVGGLLRRGMCRLRELMQE